MRICATEFFREEIRKEQGFEEFDQELFLRKPIKIKELVRAIKDCWKIDRTWSIML